MAIQLGESRIYATLVRHRAFLLVARALKGIVCPDFSVLWMELLLMQANISCTGTGRGLHNDPTMTLCTPPFSSWRALAVPGVYVVVLWVGVMPVLWARYVGFAGEMALDCVYI